MNNENQKILALTFDDGPSTGTMVRIMELLRRYDAKATFFVVGDSITGESAPMLRAAVEQGHEIGNHSRSHRHMSEMGEEELLREVASVQEQVERITGIRPVLFRPPYLDVNPLMQETIRMPFVGGEGNNDWEPDCTAAERVALALRSARDGAVLLMHCFEGNEATVDALGALLPELKRQGYQMVTASQLFAEKGIVPEKGVLYVSASNGIKTSDTAGAVPL